MNGKLAECGGAEALRRRESQESRRIGRRVLLWMALALGTTAAFDAVAIVVAMRTDSGLVPGYEDPWKRPPR